ncbi:MAG: hypothetical protein F6J93_08905 [Oscillatoria sp. SIO1A7]|nr:hypothetical protein [Oscillatoria sp. SIO1A7]
MQSLKTQNSKLKTQNSQQKTGFLALIALLHHLRSLVPFLYEAATNHDIYPPFGRSPERRINAA